MLTKAIITLCLILSITPIYSQSFGKNSFFLIKSPTNVTILSGNSSSSNPTYPLIINQSELSLYVLPSKFGLPDLNQALLGYSSRIDTSLAIGLNLYGLSGELYSTFAGSGIVAYEARRKFSIALEVQYDAITIKRSNSEGLLTLNVGGIVHLDDMFSAGIILENLNRAHYKGGEESVFTRASIGVGINLNDKLIIEPSAIVNINGSSGMSFAGKYHLADYLDARLAFATAPRLGMIELFLKELAFANLLISSTYHQTLGFSNVIGVNMRF